VSDARFAILACCAALLTACSGTQEDTPLVQQVAPAPLSLTVTAKGTLQARETTQIFVPGSTQWSQARLDWIAPDGAPVEAGDVVARFSAERSRDELKEAELRIAQTEIERHGASSSSLLAAARTEKDLAKVASERDISRIFAKAADGILARNKVLDAIQDEKFLDYSEAILQQRKDGIPTLEDASLSVVAAHRTSYERIAEDRRKDLAALEIKAPHAGLFMVERNWAGDKVHQGTTLPAGNVFGNLPDPRTMEIEATVAQIDGDDLRPGMHARFWPVGKPGEAEEGDIAWISTGAHVQTNESPVKYYKLKLRVSDGPTLRNHWAPGQAFEVTVTLWSARRAISVPNLALGSRGGRAFVMVRRHGRYEEQAVTTGHRGIDRTEVVSGLAPDMGVVVNLSDLK